MDLKRRGTIALLMTGTMAGGALGATVLSAASSSAAATNTTSTSASSSNSAPGQYGGRFVPNENPAHEKTESAQREAQENSGQVPTVP